MLASDHFVSVSNSPMIVVVMGVSGCGKTTIGTMLATCLGIPFLEGDDLHPASNIEKMTAGVALSDADREPWLEAVAGRIAIAHATGTGLVVTCSALRKIYRDVLRGSSDNLRFAWLDANQQTLFQRIGKRGGHYMKPNMLASQLATLEKPSDEPDVTRLGANCDPDSIINLFLASQPCK